tara:strand:- start:745 stop:1488 length:744 start_codon:yes stop_codon:yes gene_type:complete
MTKKVANHSLHQGSENSGKTTANTSESYPSIAPLVHKSGSRGVWHRSSKRNPCLICDRTKDGKCSYRENEIHCYDGTSHYPDRSLKIGEVFETEWGTSGLHETTRRWALVSKSGGWSGNHYVFVPDKKKNKAEYIYKEKCKEKASRNKLNKLFNIIFKNAEKALFKDLALLNLKQLDEVSSLVEETLVEVKIFLDLCATYPIQEINASSQLSNLIENIQTYKNQLNLRKKHIVEFREICLGEDFNAK